jgi:erythronate-4-phosphate dehydrogenase
LGWVDYFSWDYAVILSVAKDLQGGTHKQILRYAQDDNGELSNMKIVADSHIPYLSEYFGASGTIVQKEGRDISRDDVKDADILLVRSITRVDEHLLSGSRVKFVGSVTAGADHLDTIWLDQAGIQWRVAAGFNAPPVADYVVSVVAALQRKQLLEQEGMKAAVIGVGNVGKLVVDKLNILNFDVVQCDPLREDDGFQSTHLSDINDVDLISLHVPLTTSGGHPTYHLIDKAFLQRQKKGCVLVNASRGAVIDSVMLMLHGTHLQWCLDVWENEPAIDKNMLNHALIATPHIAGYSVQSKIRGVEMIYRAACEKGIISSGRASPIELPQQELVFSGANHHWQDIVLGIFNPMIMTAMMRTQLLPDEAGEEEFDEMRNKFTYRHELASTRVVGANMLERDKLVLERLGLSCSRLQ